MLDIHRPQKIQNGKYVPTPINKDVQAQLKKDISLKEDEDYIYEAISQLNNQQIGKLSHILFEE